MISMMWAGYNSKARETVATRILAKYNSNITNYEEYGRPIYRSKAERKLQVKPDKSDWFRGDGTTTTLVVPTTHNSELARIIRNTLKTNKGPRGTQVRVVEQPGIKLMSKLIKSDPFPMDWCGRIDCPIYRQGDSCLGKCYKESILYRSVCRKCEESQENVSDN